MLLHRRGEGGDVSQLGGRGFFLWGQFGQGGLVDAEGPEFHGGVVGDKLERVRTVAEALRENDRCFDRGVRNDRRRIEVGEKRNDLPGRHDLLRDDKRRFALVLGPGPLDEAERVTDVPILRADDDAA